MADMLFDLFSNKKPNEGDEILVIGKDCIWRGKFFDTNNPKAPNGVQDIIGFYAFGDDSVWFDMGDFGINRLDNEIAKMAGLNYGK